MNNQANHAGVLIVDDIVGQRETIANFLEKHDYETYTVADGQSAIKALKKTPAAAAIVDIKLPDTSGEKLAARLNEINPDLEIILMTGYASVETAIGAVQSGVSAYLTKPLDMDLLLAELKKAIEHRRLVLNNRQLLEELKQELAERKRMEEEILTLKKMESLGVLAGGIAHDFNNILTTILGNISFIRTAISPEGDEYEAMVEAEEGCREGRNLTQQLLTFARGGEPVKKTINISESLKEAVSFVLSGSNVRCRFEIAPNLRPVNADPGQIHQAISNLVINADHAMPEGGTVTVRAENVTIVKKDGLPLEEGEYLRISISDTGVGIKKENLSLIFDPYFTTSSTGSGLGLAGVYSIVTKHGGHVTVESKPGVGTSFYIYLPASSKKIESRKETKEDVVQGSGRILLMDDDEMIRKVAGRLIQRIGYEVDTATNGREAIEKYREAKKAGIPFDAVILDLTVPGGMGGKETIPKLKEIDPAVKAIVSSGYSSDSIMANYAKAGFAGVIPKPYKMSTLSRILAGVINRTQIHTDRNTDEHRSP